jgi:hypothetical protein
VVKKGSKVCKQPVPSYSPVYEKKIPKLIESGHLIVREDHLELATDMEFRTPSGASDLVFGASSSGWKHWVDGNGTTLDDLCPRSAAEKWRKDWTSDGPGKDKSGSAD